MFSTLNVRALLVSTVATLLLVAAIIAGSRNLQNFDAALVAYLFGSVFAWFGLVYRYAVWLQRPSTQLYWRRGWQFFFSGRMFLHGGELVKHAFADLATQCGHGVLAGVAAPSRQRPFPPSLVYQHDRAYQRTEKTSEDTGAGHAGGENRQG